MRIAYLEKVCTQYGTYFKDILHPNAKEDTEKVILITCDCNVCDLCRGIKTVWNQVDFSDHYEKYDNIQEIFYVVHDFRNRSTVICSNKIEAKKLVGHYSILWEVPEKHLNAIQDTIINFNDYYGLLAYQDSFKWITL
jgi:hypothetical protein